jgi:suppressor for copper-sensitivity B
LIIKLIFTVLTFLASTLSLNASESPWIWGKTQKSQVRLIAPFTAVSPETKTLRVGLEFKLAKGWHVYWKNPGRVGYPPRADWTLPQGWTHSPIHYPTPERFQAASFETYGYHDQVIYLVDLTGRGIEGKFFQASVKLDYLVCELQCIPEKAELKISLKNSQEELSPFAQAIDEASRKLPSAMSPALFDVVSEGSQSFSIRFKGPHTIENIFPFALSGKTQVEVSRLSNNHYSLVTQPNHPGLEILAVWKDGKSSVGGIIEIPKGSELGGISEILLALLFAFLGGLILNLMPCVLPVIGLKTISLVKLGIAQTSDVRRSALLTCLGILASFFALALLLLSLRAAGQQVGWGFQFQSPAFISFLIAVVFVFALNLFGLFEFSLPASGSTWMQRIQRGPFWEGALATLMATPCSAPFLGTALTFALTQPSWLLVIFFLTMGVGLSTPYLLLAVLPGALRLFPRPGPWMETLKRILGYSLLIAVFWLLYILQQQTNTLFLCLVLGLLLMIFITFKEIKGKRAWVLVSLMTLAIIYGAERKAPSTSDEASSKNSTLTEAALQEKLISGKTFYLVVTADWCLTCKYNEAFVMKSEWFKNLLKSHQVEVLIYDWTSRDEAIGKFLESYNRFAIPFSMLISKDKHVVFPELLNRPNVEEHFQKYFNEASDK